MSLEKFAQIRNETLKLQSDLISEKHKELLGIIEETQKLFPEYVSPIGSKSSTKYRKKGSLPVEIMSLVSTDASNRLTRRQIIDKLADKTDMSTVYNKLACMLKQSTVIDGFKLKEFAKGKISDDSYATLIKVRA